MPKSEGDAGRVEHARPAAGRSAAASSRQHDLLALVLLWLAGVTLRLSILSVPPVLPAIQADLKLSGTEVGLLSSLPVLVFALVALPGSLLISRVGALRALVGGMLLAALASAWRGAVGTALELYAATTLIGAGIALMQPAFPPIVRQWLPQRIGFATAVFTNGLIVGEFIPVLLMQPLVLPLVGGSWRAALAFWAVPLFVIALLTVALRPRPAGADADGAPAPRWWPDWRDPRVWRMSLIVAAINSLYFGANAFIPGHLESVGRADLIGPALSWLNLGQLPASLLLLLFAGRLELRAWPFVATGLASLASVAGIALTASGATVAFAGALGFFGAAILVLSLALPALLMPPADVARTSAAMFAIGYGEAVLVSVLGGAMWDLTGHPAAAFIPLALSALPLLFLPVTLFSASMQGRGRVAASP